MSVYYKAGDLLESGCEYLCHQCNCQGSMKAGIAKTIAEKYPIVDERYQAKCKHKNILGDIQVISIEDSYIVNMFSQEYYGPKGERYTDYEAFYKCLEKIAEVAAIGSTIGFPDHIACDRAGANWNIIKTMIEEVLGEQFEVYIYHLQKGE